MNKNVEINNFDKLIKELPSIISSVYGGVELRFILGCFYASDGWHAGYYRVHIDNTMDMENYYKEEVWPTITEALHELNLWVIANNHKLKVIKIQG